MTQNVASREKLHRLVRMYSWVTVVAVVYGLGAAHVPFLINIPWSSCTVCGSTLGCVLVFHLFEVPIVSFHAFLAWYGLKRYTAATLPVYNAMISVAIAANLAFSVFEIGLLLDGLRRENPFWETVLLVSVTLTLMGGAALATYVKVRIAAVQGGFDGSNA
ncbi:hypothetical protein BH10BAC6_BH10BAC6_07660 [soil metagenome]